MNLYAYGWGAALSLALGAAAGSCGLTSNYPRTTNRSASLKAIPHGSSIDFQTPSGVTLVTASSDPPPDPRWNRLATF